MFTPSQPRSTSAINDVAGIAVGHVTALPRPTGCSGVIAGGVSAYGMLWPPASELPPRSGSR